MESSSRSRTAESPPRAAPPCRGSFQDLSPDASLFFFFFFFFLADISSSSSLLSMTSRFLAGGLRSSTGCVLAAGLRSSSSPPYACTRRCLF